MASAVSMPSCPAVLSTAGTRSSAYTRAWLLFLLALWVASSVSVAGGESAPAAGEPPAVALPALPGGDEVLLDGYYIDRFEYPNRPGVLPRVDVTWAEAQSLCRSRGKRLCTEREWEDACRGPAGFAYGYGAQFEPGRCNTPTQVNGIWRRGPGLSPVGAHPACGNDDGAVDLIGNAWEWTDGWYDRDKVWRTVRGGSWFNSANMARADVRYGRHLSASYHLDLVGFRCCRSVEPAATEPDAASR